MHSGSSEFQAGDATPSAVDDRGARAITQPEMVGVVPVIVAPPTPVAPGPRVGDVVFVSLENWDDIWRRNQFVCADLARRFPGDRILFVGIPHDLSSMLRRGALIAFLKALFNGGRSSTPIPTSPNITFSRPLKLLPNSIGFGRRINERLLRRHIRKHARRSGVTSPLLWLNAHWAGALAGTLNERAVVYDITDDWALSETQDGVELLRQQDLDLCRRADLVVVCSDALLQSRKPVSRRILLLPNGVNSDHYAGVLNLPPGDRGVASQPAVSSDPTSTDPAAAALLAEAAAWKSPVFGYTGTLHMDRVDAELVRALAKANPAGTVALVGPCFFPPEVQADLRGIGNVRLTGAAPYAIIPPAHGGF